jgi:hypothetical protein
MYETYFLQNWLPRWNQILTQLSFIHNLIITGIQWMVCWFTVEPQEQLSITFVLSSYAHTHLTTLLTDCRAMWVSYEPFKDGTWTLIILFYEIICFDKFPTKFPTYELFRTILTLLTHFLSNETYLSTQQETQLHFGVWKVLWWLLLLSS